jgi:hypothetical protein
MIKNKTKRTWRSVINETTILAANFLWSIYLLIMIDTLLLRPSLHSTTLYPTSLHFTTLVDTSLHLQTIFATLLFLSLHPVYNCFMGNLLHLKLKICSSGPERRTWYSDHLPAGWCGDQIPAETSPFLPKRPNRLWGPPSLILKGTGVLFWG